MKFSRRHFLKLSTRSLAALLAASSSCLAPLLAGAAEGDIQSASPEKREIFLLNDLAQPMPKFSEYAPVPGVIKVYDVAAKEMAVIDVPFFGHTNTQCLLEPEHFMSFQKWGTLGGLVDVKNKTLLQPIPANTDSRFFGHAAFFKEGSVFVCAEETIGSEKGSLIMRSFPDMKILGEFPTYGGNPHECRVVDDGKTILVANNVTKPPRQGSLAWVDARSGKLLNEILFENLRFSPSHLDISYDGWVCTSGRMLPQENKRNIGKLLGFVSPSGQAFQAHFSPDLNKRLRGEALSIAFLGKSGLVAITVLEADLVLVMDYKKQKLVEMVDIKAPKGVVYELGSGETQPGFFVSSGENKNFFEVQAHRDGSSNISLVQQGFGGAGSHMIRAYI